VHTYTHTHIHTHTHTAHTHTLGCARTHKHMQDTHTHQLTHKTDTFACIHLRTGTEYNVGYRSEGNAVPRYNLGALLFRRQSRGIVLCSPSLSRYRPCAVMDKRQIQTSAVAPVSAATRNTTSISSTRTSQSDWRIPQRRRCGGSTHVPPSRSRCSFRCRAA